MLGHERTLRLSEMEMSEAECSRFQRLCERMGIAERVVSLAWHSLWLGYTESHRHYHNWEHIGSMLAALDCVSGIDESRGRDRIEMAVWFHDVVYDPKSSTNEADSAALFRQLLGAELDTVDVAAIERLILATDPRRDRGDAEDEKILVDIDLLVLASDPSCYCAYADAIRKEYVHVPEDAFVKGRLEVLERILQKPIFMTEHFAKREEKARANLEDEIETLS